MIISRTPYRLSFVGGGTDYPAWYEENGGAVISTTINHYCYISLRYLPPFFEHKYLIVYSQIETPNRIEDIYHPSVRECLRYMNIGQGVAVSHHGDLPARSGIGSSSAFTVGLLNALHTLKGESTSKLDLAIEAIRVEQDLIKENVGSQDQCSVALGGLNLIRFGHGKPEVQALNLSRKRIRELESCLMLVFTGFPHYAGEVAGTYQFQRHKMELTKMLQLTWTALHTLKKGCLSDLGSILHESWQLKRSLSNRVSTPYIDYVYDTAIKNGASGGKLVGAGGGGFMLLYCEADKQSIVKEALRGLLFVPFKFETGGSIIIVNSRE